MRKEKKVVARVKVVPYLENEFQYVNCGEGCACGNGCGGTCGHSGGKFFPTHCAPGPGPG